MPFSQLRYPVGSPVTRESEMSKDATMLRFPFSATTTVIEEDGR